MLLRFAKLTAYLPLRLIYGLKIINGRALGREKCIFAVNHASMLDPLVLNIALPFYRIWALSSKKLFKCPSVCRAFLRHSGAIPSISPAEDMKAMLARARQTRAGERIAFFAPGGIMPTSSAFRPGAALLALQTRLPVVPVYIRVSPFYRGGSVLKAGGRVYPPDESLPFAARAEAFTESIRSEMIKLIPTEKQT